METHHGQLPPYRLMEVVDALSEALEELGWARWHRHPLDVLGTMQQPRAMCDCTRFEVEEASRFLARMGMLETSTGQCL